MDQEEKKYLSLSLQDEKFFSKLEKKRGPLKGLYRYLLNHPPLLRKVASLGGQLRFQSSLPPFPLKYLILSTAKKLFCRRVWQTHSREAQKIGMPSFLWESLFQSSLPSQSPYQELELWITCAYQRQPISQKVSSLLKSTYGEKGWIELGLTFGFYQMLITTSYSLGIDHPDETFFKDLPTSST